MTDTTKVSSWLFHTLYPIFNFPNSAWSWVCEETRNACLSDLVPTRWRERFFYRRYPSEVYPLMHMCKYWEVTDPEKIDVQQAWSVKFGLNECIKSFWRLLPLLHLDLLKRCSFCINCILWMLLLTSYLNSLEKNGSSWWNALQNCCLQFILCHFTYWWNVCK